MMAAYSSLLEARNPLEREVRKHSVSAAALSGYLASATDLGDPGEAALVGLMHDVGKMLLVQSGELDYQNLGLQEGKLCRGAHHLERARIGYDHAVLGELALRLWNFPAHLALAVGMHHYEALPPNLDPRTRNLVELTSLADSLDAALRNDRPLEEVRIPSNAAAQGVSEARLRTLWPELVRVRNDALTQLL
jgi:HD-like signal output (HDOD) protein